MKKNLNRTQMAGLILIGLSLVTFIAGGTLVSSWLLSVEPSGVHIYVKDAETNQHIAKDLVTVTVTGFSYMGYDVPLNVVLRPSRTTPTYWGFSSSLYCLYYVSITATGYVTQTGNVSMPQNYIKEYTFKLDLEPPQGDPEPEPTPPEESPDEAPPVEAEVYVNGVRVMQGETVTVDTLDLVVKAVVTEGAASVQQLYGFVDEERLIFEASDNQTEYVATYTLPRDGEYDINVRVLDTGGRDTLLASLVAVYGDAEAPEPGSVDEAVEEALGRTSTLLSAALACMGVGVYMLGSLKEEKRR